MMNFLIALFLHIILFGLFIFFSAAPLAKPSIHDEISAYIVHGRADKVPIKVKNKQKRQDLVKKRLLPLQKSFVKNVNQHKKVNADRASQTKENLVSSLKQQGKESLLSLLHLAIAAKQSYPPAALMLKKRGTVRIRFLLFPDGHMTQIALLKSSGFSNLDSSALTAVKEIMPFKEAANYLRHETFFSVDVVFE